MDEKKMIQVEVAYAKAEQQALLSLQVELGSTVEKAIEASGILTQFPEIDLENTQVGVFSKVCKLHQVLHNGDRVEIYRPLLIDPKESRRQKAGKGKSLHVDSAD